MVEYYCKARKLSFVLGAIVRPNCSRYQFVLLHLMSAEEYVFVLNLYCFIEVIFSARWITTDNYLRNKAILIENMIIEMTSYAEISSCDIVDIQLFSVSQVFNTCKMTVIMIKFRL